jgi:L-ectoine synthase
VKIISISDVENTPREVHCPKGGFTSLRFLLARDGMGFSVHKTVIPVGEPQHWHYKNHLEACYCVSGWGVVTNLKTGQQHMIREDTLYALDEHDDMTFQALQPTVLISIFNPPVIGDEVHGPDGSYVSAEDYESVDA